MQYTTKEAADKCHREHSTIRRLCKQHGVGKLVGRKRLLSSADMLWLRLHIKTHGSERKRRSQNSSVGQ